MTSTTSSPIPRRHSEMPVRATPLRKISTFTEGGGAEGAGEMRRGSSAITNEQRKARREQFRNFYGLKEGQAQGHGQGQAGTSGEGGLKGNVLDIDSTSFNASAYYEDLITKNNLEGLMKKASTLNADIGNLEGSRHSLVYNHHHQLFAAGDTISKLNSRTPQLLSIVNELQESFSKIEQLIDSITFTSPTTAAAAAGNQKSKSKDQDRISNDEVEEEERNENPKSNGEEARKQD